MKMLENLLSGAMTYPKIDGFFIYFLLRKNEICYIGKSNSLGQRISAHSKDKTFDEVKYIPVPEEHQSVLELALIKAVRPQYNTQPLSRMTKNEEALLKQYCSDGELLASVIRAQPTVQIGDFGSVAFLKNGKFVFGLYDDDAAPDDDDDHREDCEYIAAREDISKHIEISDALDNELSERCDCTRAIVYGESIHAGYWLLDYEDLYSVDGVECLKPHVKKYEADFLKLSWNVSLEAPEEQ